MSSYVAKTRIKPAGLRRCGLVAAALFCPVTAYAGLKFSGWGGAQYEYNSNIFEVDNLREAMVRHGVVEVDDTITRYKAGGELAIEGGQQRLRAIADVAQVVYQRNSEFDHDEHRFAGVFEWKLAETVDGEVHYRHERQLAPFADVDVSILSLQTQQLGFATFNVAVTPSWRVETRAQALESELPITDERTFTLRESEGAAGLKYTGISDVTAGVVVEYATGEYRGAIDEQGNRTDADYDEIALESEVDYVYSGVSKFHGEAGVTQREETPIFGVGGVRDTSKVTAFTGELGYERKVSDKTKAEVALFQRLDSYVGGANTVIETGASAGAEWKPTELITVGGEFGLSRADFRTGEDGDAGRNDRYFYSSLEVGYQALRWLVLRGFGDFRNRSSSELDAGFEAFVGGMELRATFQD